MKARVADPEVAQLAVPHAAVAERANHERAADIGDRPFDAKSAGLVVDGPLRDAELENLFQQAAYSPADKRRILAPLETLGLLNTRRRRSLHAAGWVGWQASAASRRLRGVSEIP